MSNICLILAVYTLLGPATCLRLPEGFYEQLEILRKILEKKLV